MIVTLNSNGKYWQAQWTDATGIRRRRGLGLKADLSRRDATKMCAAIAAKEASNPSPDGKAPTLDQWREKYLSLRADELAEGTLYLHKLTFQYLADHFKGSVRIDRINRVSAAAWAAGLGLGAQSRCLHVRNAKVIFQRAVDLDLLNANPFDRENGTPPQVTKEWADITNDQMLRLLSACPNIGWVHLFSLCRWAGLRRGEALRVRWGDIDWSTHILTVRADATTTKARRRTVPLVPDLFAMLEAGFRSACDGSDGPTDGVSQNNLVREANAIIARAGLPPYEKPFHTLRKCCETAWAAEHPILDVAAWLGHSPTVAAKHYVRTTPETIAKVTGPIKQEAKA